MLDGTRDRLIFVLGKMDLLNEDERVGGVELRRRRASPSWRPARRCSRCRRGSGWSGATRQRHAGAAGPPEERFLAGDRARILLDNAAVDAARTAATSSTTSACG
jgi:hypothetical protein